MEISKFKDVMQDCNINFLFGSGMSMPYLKTLGSIEILLTDLEKDESLNKEQKEFLRCSIYKTFFDVVIEKNIDILINNASSLSVLDSYKEFFEKLNLLMLRRRNKLLSKQVNIFTTNIDIFLEKAVEDKCFEYNDGFTGRFKPKYDLSNFKKSTFKRSLHFENSSEIPVFNIMKIHGSLTWSLENKEIYLDATLNQVSEIIQNKPKDEEQFLKIDGTEEFSALVDKLPATIDIGNFSDFIDAYNKLAIVNPTKGKFRDTVLEERYYELLRIYANELEKENTVLFVMGFSFADEHIKELTLRVANSNPTLMIYIFAHSGEARMDIERNIEKHKFKNSNITILSPQTTTDEHGNVSDDFKYDFNTINKKIFGAILEKIEPNE